MRSALEDMARNSSARGWWHSYASFLHLAFHDFLGLEHDATHVRTWQTTLVPGLLQTEYYARTLLGAGGDVVHSSPERVEKLVAVRMERKKALSATPPLRLSAVLSEAALSGLSRNANLVRGQIEHLIEASHMDSVDLRVLPLGRGVPHVGLDGAFTLFTFPDGGELASLEALVNSFYLEDTESVAAYERAFAQVTELALDEAGSRAYLQQLAQDL
jgi:hypothetical protein